MIIFKYLLLNILNSFLFACVNHHHRLPEITRGLFTFAIFISYALQCYVPISIIWENYFSDEIKKSEKSDRYLLGLRIVTTIFTFLVAAAVPHLGLFISLFGAFCLSILGLAFPAIMVNDKNHFSSLSYFYSHAMSFFLGNLRFVAW